MALQLKITQANQLGWDDLGRTVRLVGADGTSYEGALTYLSFWPSAKEDSAEVVILVREGVDLDHYIELDATHLVEVEW